MEEVIDRVDKILFLEWVTFAPQRQKSYPHVKKIIFISTMSIIKVRILLFELATH